MLGYKFIMKAIFFQIDHQPCPHPWLPWLLHGLVPYSPGGFQSTPGSPQNIPASSCVAYSTVHAYSAYTAKLTSNSF